MADSPIPIDTLNHQKTISYVHGKSRHFYPHLPAKECHSLINVIAWFAMAGMSIAEVGTTVRATKFDYQHLISGGCLVSNKINSLKISTAWTILLVYDIVIMTLMFIPAANGFLSLANLLTSLTLPPDYFDVVIFTGRVIRANLACRVVLHLREMGQCQRNGDELLVYAYCVTLEYYVEVRTQMFSKRFDLLTTNSSGNDDARTGLMNPAKFVATPNSIVTSDTALKHQQNVTLYEYFITLDLEVKFVWNTPWTFIKTIYVTNTDCIHQAIFPRTSQPKSVTISSSSPHVWLIFVGMGIAEGKAVINLKEQIILTIRIWAVWGKSGMAIKTAKSRILSREGA
ncbi:hypothetical protein BDQ17DRAFT_1499536 [Cyathus striatus]|nr:hypothetical protein BDQ17DRAFT_1499536 [Cyathus striatus]